jgi:hypothetical protein
MFQNISGLHFKALKEDGVRPAFLRLSNVRGTAARIKVNQAGKAELFRKSAGIAQNRCRVATM